MYYFGSAPARPGNERKRNLAFGFDDENDAIAIHRAQTEKVKVASVPEVTVRARAAERGEVGAAEVLDCAIAQDDRIERGDFIFQQNVHLLADLHVIALDVHDDDAFFVLAITLPVRNSFTYLARGWRSGNRARGGCRFG